MTPKLRLGYRQRAKDFCPEPRTIEQLQQLAQDIKEGKVFYFSIMDVDGGDFSPEGIAKAMIPTRCFQSLTRGSLEKNINALHRNDAVFLYEYLDKAKGTNAMGLPWFSTLQLLNLEDYERLQQLLTLREPSSVQ